MSRLMSVAMTTDAVLERRKTVTRRRGWLHLKPGDTLTLCRKVQGRKVGEPIVRLAEVEVVDVSREPLARLRNDLVGYGQPEVEREGFPGMSPGEFIRRFFVDGQGITEDTLVTRIEWRYLDHVAPTPGRVWTDDARTAAGGSRITVKRCCNGCGRRLGDALRSELDAAVVGRELPDVRDECGCSREAAAS